MHEGKFELAAAAAVVKLSKNGVSDRAGRLGSKK